MNNSYKLLNKQVYQSGQFSIVPIRFKDRYDIMMWRNEQIYHLRQSRPLTKEDQDHYFEDVISKLFDQEMPNQILFSFLKENECIGYGGLVHINWIDKNAEVSFVMDTKHEVDHFVEYWELFLKLLKIISFKELKLHKIYTYAYDLRPKLYSALELSGFVKESRLIDHCFFRNNFYDVLYHGCINPIESFKIREAVLEDANLLFEWVNDPDVRASAFNSNKIDIETHLLWYKNKLESIDTKIFIFENKLNVPFGQVRIELEKNYYVIDYSISKSFRGLGLGQVMINHIINLFNKFKFKAIVKLSNKASLQIFKNLNFKMVEQDNQKAIFYFQ